MYASLFASRNPGSGGVEKKSADPQKPGANHNAPYTCRVCEFVKQ
jgi:hypothetical protein